jgi:putative membrane protein
MYSILLRVLISTLGLLLAAYLIPGIQIQSLYIAIIGAVVLGLLNLVVKPILIILTLPINLITLGLFTFVINASLILFVATFLKGFEVDGFWSALLCSIIVSVVSCVGQRIVK